MTKLQIPIKTKDLKHYNIAWRKISLVVSGKKGNYMLVPPYSNFQHIITAHMNAKSDYSHYAFVKFTQA